MTANNYILLLANTFLEGGENIGFGKETVEFRKELFQLQLTRIHKVAERDNFVTKKEFLNHCLISVDLLKEYVSMEGYIEANRLGKNLKYFEDDSFNFFINLDPAQREAEREKRQNLIDDFDIDEYLVPMNNLNTGIYKNMSIRDIDFIEDCLLNFNFNDQTQQAEPEPLNLSETSAVEKIIYLNELGIIDFLRNKTIAGISNTRLSSVLGAITGEDAGTLRSMLNRINKKEDFLDQKHPYKSLKTVEKVKTSLTHLGFKKE